ncbi:MAG: serine/threonine protein kinase [Candidatus Hydrogenedentes bacterium]|nr:serine/threonine protein kinase [Candidatus Hydrogenedentota bacterium]
MGRIWLVRDEYINREIAMKELLGDEQGEGHAPSPTIGDDDPLSMRFLHEARITARLEHPSIAPVYEIGTREDGAPYYTMKLVRGRTLQDAIRSASGTAERLKLLPHFVDACQAVAYAHSRGVLHRDIKPSNIIVGEFGETYVLDWGLAKVKTDTDVPMAADQQAWPSGLATGAGRILGTPSYMSPEQAQGHSALVDERSDIYSLGAVLYELLAGRAPYAGKSALETIRALLDGPPSAVDKHEKTIPPDIAAVCATAMARDPRDRYQMAGQLATAAQTCELRPAKSRLRRYAERSAVMALALVLLSIALANALTERGVQRAIVALRERGIDPLAPLPEDATNEEDRPDQFALIPELRPEPIGYLYTLHQRFPFLSGGESSHYSYYFHIPAPSLSVPYYPLAGSAREELEFFLQMLRPLVDELSEIAALPIGSADQRTLRRIMEGDRDSFTVTARELNAQPQPYIRAILKKSIVLAVDSGDPLAVERIFTQYLRICRHLSAGGSHGYAKALFSSVLVCFSIVPTDFPLTDETIRQLEDAVVSFDPRQEFARKIDLEVRRAMTLYQEIEDLSLKNFTGGTRLTQFYSKEARPTWTALTMYLYQKWPFRWYYNMDRLFTLEATADRLDASRVYFHDASEEIARLQARRDRYFRFNSSLFPIANYYNTNPVTRNRASTEFDRLAREIIHVHQASVALALRRYYAVHNEYPDTLDSLFPAAPESSIVDPFTGEPLLYLHDERGYVLAAAARDRKRSLYVSDDLLCPCLVLKREILRYRRQHGVFPASQADLVPDYLPAMPVDLCSQLPVVYRRTDASYEIDVLNEDHTVRETYFGSGEYYSAPEVDAKERRKQSLLYAHPGDDGLWSSEPGGRALRWRLLREQLCAPEV